MTEVFALATFFEPSSPEPLEASDISWVAVPSFAVATAGFLVGLALGDAAWAVLPIARPRMSDRASTAEEFLFIGGV